jgi:hypothetical protein
VSTLTVRNIPEEAKRRFRQVAAAHGRSMEEHLRQLIVEAEFPRARADRVAEKPASFEHATSREDWLRELIRIADGAGEAGAEPGRYSAIRFLTAKDAMAELRRLANGAGFEAPPALATDLEAPEF